MEGKQLRAWRKTMGFTQHQAAVQLGISVRTIQEMEKTEASRLVWLATQALSIRAMWPVAVEALKPVSAVVKGMRDH